MKFFFGIKIFIDKKALLFSDIRIKVGVGFYTRVFLYTAVHGIIFFTRF